VESPSIRRRPHGSVTDRVYLVLERSRRAPKAYSFVVVFATCLIAVLGIQLIHGAYFAAFDGAPDEAAHVVTSLLYRQFILAPTLEPLAFAKHYYSHYQNLAAGHWPPGLHLPAAIWMVLFGSGRTQLLIYVAIVTALTAALLFVTIRSFGTRSLAVLFCGVWLLLEVSQAAATQFMTEGQSALLVTAAAVSYVWYLRAPSYRRGLLFGVLAAIAILTKETALALALIPPVSVALLGRWELLKTRHFWLPAIVVMALVTPWHYWVGTQGVGRYAVGVGLARLTGIVSELTVQQKLLMFAHLLGWPLLCLAAWGVVARLRSATKHRDGSLVSAVFGSLLLGGLLFHLSVPESAEQRHLYQLTPALVLFAAAGAWALAERLSGQLRLLVVTMLALGCVLLSISQFTTSRKASPASLEIVTTAESIIDSSAARTLLVAEKGRRAGPVIAEIALQEPSPNRHLIRDSKTLYSANWNGNFYERHFALDEKLRRFLNESGIDTIVYVSSEHRPRRPHETLVVNRLQAEGSPWREDAAVVNTHVKIYRHTVPIPLATRPISLQMNSRWHSAFEIEPGHDHASGSLDH
jgi:hypothetical protein